MQLNLFVKDDIPPQKPGEVGRKWFCRTVRESMHGFRPATDAEYMQSLRFIDTAEIIYTIPLYAGDIPPRVNYGKEYMKRVAV